MSQPFTSRAVPRRNVVAGMAALGLCGLARGPAAAQGASEQSPGRPLAERLAAYADRSALRRSRRRDRRGRQDRISSTRSAAGSRRSTSGRCASAATSRSPPAAAPPPSSAPNRRTSPDLAAFANGVAFRYYDLNDIYVGRQAGHPSDHIAACLAVAEAERASAAELITAIVLAYEINCRLIDAFDLTTRGWDPPVFSLPAVALAAGKLMKLGPDRLAQAVNLAINDHIPMGQTRVQTLSDWKGLADAEAGAQCGVRGAAGARRPHRSGADLRRTARASSSWCRGRPMSMSTPSAGAASRSGSTSAA